MSVTFDANCTDTYGFSNGGLAFTPGITVGSGSNRALVALLQFDVDPGTVTVTWDSGGTNQSMTLIEKLVNSGGTGCAILFGLVAPTSGEKKVLVSWANTITDNFFSAVSFTGVNQTGGATTFYNATSAQNSNTSGLTLTVTAATTDAAVCAWAGCNASGITTQTPIFNDHTNGQTINAAGAYNTGSASVGFTTTGNQGFGGTAVGCAIAEVSAAPQYPYLNSFGLPVNALSDHPGPVPRVSPDDTIKDNQGAIFGNLLTGWPGPPARYPQHRLAEHLDQPWRFPDPIFPDQALLLGAYLRMLPYPKENAAFIADYKHPPATIFHSPEIWFPNLQIFEKEQSNLNVLMIVAQFVAEYRNAPPPPHSFEWVFTNYLAKNIPGSTPVAAEFIRNMAPELAQIREASPALTQARQQQYILSQIRNFLPKLSE